MKRGGRTGGRRVLTIGKASGCCRGKERDLAWWGFRRNESNKRPFYYAVADAMSLFIYLGRELQWPLRSIYPPAVVSYIHIYTCIHAYCILVHNYVQRIQYVNYTFRLNYIKNDFCNFIVGVLKVSPFTYSKNLISFNKTNWK